MSSGIQTALSLASSSAAEDSAAGRVKLRLCFNGRFEQTPSQQGWRFVGGEYFNESILYGVRYADFMFKLSEKFKTAVSVKYQPPGEELDPDGLISVQDDGDLQELMEDYRSHLERPGTPSKTFRIKVFVFMAAEEPLTPDEIMEGQSFFSAEPVQDYVGDLSLQQLTVSAAVQDRISSRGSTYPPDAYEHPSYSQSMWAAQQHRLMNASASEAGAPEQLLGHDLGSQGDAAADGEVDEGLEEVIAAIAEHEAQRQLAAAQQLGVLTGPEDRYALLQELAGQDQQYQEDEQGEYAEGEYAEEVEYAEESQPADEIDESDAAAEAAAYGDVDEAVAARVGSVEERSTQADTEEASLPADPWAMSEEAAQQPDEDSQQLRNLPSHISAFGGDSSEMPGEADLGVQIVEAGAGDTVLDAIDVAGHLPSHISAFGDDRASGLVNSAGLCAGSEDAEAAASREAANDGDGQLAVCMGSAYERPRTQDSEFSLDGAADEQLGIQARVPTRQGSGDSLASLPKLQPVHRLAKPDLKIVSVIGEGAFGEVSLATAPLYGQVAVKWLKSDRFSKYFASFGREAALLADLNHPNVLRFYGVVTETAKDNTVIGIMTEYVRGGSLSSFLRMSRSRLPLRTRCELALGAANGLAYLHELRIVHFDLKPDNLLLDAPPAVVRSAAGGDQEEEPECINIAAAAGAAQQGNVAWDSDSSSGPWDAAAATPGTSSAAGGGRSPSSSSRGAACSSALGRSSSGPAVDMPVVKVADFGLSKHKLDNFVSACHDLRGTLPYMCPELVARPEEVDEKADVWSLGVVMWEMFTRQNPHQALTPAQILTSLLDSSLTLQIPASCEPEWRQLIEACLEPEPSNRPSMRQLARQLEAIRDEQVQLEREQQQAQGQVMAQSAKQAAPQAPQQLQQQQANATALQQQQAVQQAAAHPQQQQQQALQVNAPPGQLQQQVQQQVRLPQLLQPVTPVQQASAPPLQLQQIAQQVPRVATPPLPLQQQVVQPLLPVNDYALQSAPLPQQLPQINIATLMQRQQQCQQQQSQQDYYQQQQNYHQQQQQHHQEQVQYYQGQQQSFYQQQQQQHIQQVGWMQQHQASVVGAAAAAAAHHAAGGSAAAHAPGVQGLQLPGGMQPCLYGVAGQRY